MEIELLEEFVTLARFLNYRKASEQLFITQTTLTRHIQQLEAQLGVPLFNHTTRSVSITPQGSMLLDGARSICDTY